MEAKVSCIATARGSPTCCIRTSAISSYRSKGYYWYATSPTGRLRCGRAASRRPRGRDRSSQYEESPATRPSLSASLYWTDPAEERSLEHESPRPSAPLQRTFCCRSTRRTHGWNPSSLRRRGTQCARLRDKRPGFARVPSLARREGAWRAVRGTSCRAQARDTTQTSLGR